MQGVGTVRSHEKILFLSLRTRLVFVFLHVLG